MPYGQRNYSPGFPAIQGSTGCQVEKSPEDVDVSQEYHHELKIAKLGTGKRKTGSQYESGNGQLAKDAGPGNFDVIPLIVWRLESAEPVKEAQFDGVDAATDLPGHEAMAKLMYEDNAQVRRKRDERLNG